MRRFIIPFVALLFLTGAIIYAQDVPQPETPEQPAEPAQPEKPDAETPGEPEKPEAQDDGIVVYLDIRDITDGKEYKWRVVQFMIRQMLELANPDNEQKFKGEWAKRQDWTGISDKEKEKKIDEYYRHLRKEKGVSSLKLEGLEVLTWKPRPKKKAENKEEPEKGEGQTSEEAGGEEAEKEEGQKEEEKKEEKEEEWVDPRREKADYIIEGEATFKKGKTSEYFGETVEWKSHGSCDIKAKRASDGEVIKIYKKDDVQQGDTRGQEEAHQRCMRVLGQALAQDIVKLREWKDALREKKRGKSPEK